VKRYEYTERRFKPEIGIGDLDRQLQELGAAGWHLSAVAWNGLFIFARLLPEHSADVQAQGGGPGLKRVEYMTIRYVPGEEVSVPLNQLAKVGWRLIDILDGAILILERLVAELSVTREEDGAMRRAEETVAAPQMPSPHFVGTVGTDYSTRLNAAFPKPSLASVQADLRQLGTPQLRQAIESAQQLLIARGVEVAR